MDRSETPAAPRPALGILLLENKATSLPGAMAHPATFAYPTRSRTVRGAWVANVLRGDPTLGGAFVDAARALVGEGAAALTTNCGFSVAYQARLAAEIDVPVASSSLLLLPLMARLLPAGRKVGILTYDARSLTAAHLRAAGMAGDDLPIAIAGIDGSDAWAELQRPEPNPKVEQLERDVLAAARQLLDAHPEIALILLECAAFCAVAPSVRAAAGRPVFDFVTLANLLMASVGSPTERRS